MVGVIAATPGGVARVLVGIAAALGGAALCVLLSTGTAHADTLDGASTASAPTAAPDHSGLLGGVLRDTGGLVGDVVATVAAPAPAPAAAPSPSAPQAVQSVTRPVSVALDSTVGSVPVIGTLTSGLVGAAPVESLTSPVADALDASLGGTGPVVGSILGSNPPVAAPWPADLAVIAASAGVSGVAPSAVPRSVGDATVVILALPGAQSDAPGGLTLPAVPLLPTLGGLTPASVVSSGGAAPGSAAALMAIALLLAMPVLGRRRPLVPLLAPVRPVYDTDCSPD